MSEQEKRGKVVVATGLESTKAAPRKPEDPPLPPELEHRHRGNNEYWLHDVHFKEDLKLIKETLGTDIVRIPIPWYRIEVTQGIYDWSWMDQYLLACEENGIEPIGDFCHHSSAPEWTNFADPDFPEHFARYIAAFVERYGDRVKLYCLINEPTATSMLCTDQWYPNLKGKNAYHRMLKNMAKAICLGTAIVNQHIEGAQFYFTDPVQHQQAVGNDENVYEEARQFNETGRFELLDLLLGNLGPDHPSYNKLIEKGFTPEELKWFTVNPAQIDILALDYYLHVEQVIGNLSEGESLPPARGPATLILDYYERYKDSFPDMQFAIGEVNVRGKIFDRISWLKFCLLQAEQLQRALGDRFHSITWFPALDSAGWGNRSLATRFTGDGWRDLDPTGLLLIDPDTPEYERRVTELAHLVYAYINGEITAEEMVAYSFDPEMHNYPMDRLGHLMQDFEFVAPGA